MDGQPEMIGHDTGYAVQGWDLAKGWLLSPAAWSQFGFLVIASWLLAVIIHPWAQPLRYETAFFDEL